MHQIFCVSDVNRNLQIKNIWPFIKAFLKPRKSFTPDIRTEISCPSRKLGHEMNLKGSLCLALYLPGDFIAVAENL